MQNDRPSAIHASKVKRHLEKMSPNWTLQEKDVAHYAVSLLHFVDELKGNSLEGLNLEKLFVYQVPTIDPDGCSRLDGTFSPEPYDLREVLGFPNQNGLISRPETRQLFILDAVVEKVMRDSGVNWLGFYQRRNHKDRGDLLVKLVYRGTESRAEFPLTREFARKSNNSNVGLTGTAVVINDIEKYLWEKGGPYYQCDSKVHSEACLPVFSPSSPEVIGILDAESFERNKFTEKELSILVATSIVLEDFFVRL